MIKKLLSLISDTPSRSPAPLGSKAEALISEMVAGPRPTGWSSSTLKDFEEGRKLLKADSSEQKAVALDLIRWLTQHELERQERSKNSGSFVSMYGSGSVVRQSLEELLRKNLPFSEDEVLRVVDWSLLYDYNAFRSIPVVIKQAQDFLKREGRTPKVKKKLEEYVKVVETGVYEDAETRQHIRKLHELAGREARSPIVPGEAWSDEAIRFLSESDASIRASWIEILNICVTARGSAPTAKWSKSAAAALDKIGWDRFREAVLGWFPLVDKPRTVRIPTWPQWAADPNDLINDHNADILKGLVWMSATRSDSDVVRATTSLAISAYKKIPQVGPRCVRVGNACVWALSSSDAPNAVGSLAVLKVRIRFGTAQKALEKAFAQAAARANLPKDEIEEMSVPDHGLAEVGRLVEHFGDYRAELNVNGTDDASISWFTSEDKQLKSVPAAVKRDHAEGLKELNQTLKDIRQMLPAQRTRIDCLFLEQKKWPFETWRERYHDHNLVGTIARRLIWKFSVGSAPPVSAIWLDGQFVTSASESLNIPPDSTSVELWHPLDEPTGAVLSWRDFLEQHTIRQPFKQAHREIYLLTDAERNTRVYSNRYAAHLLKQHQFNALCSARSWKNRLRLMVDAELPPATRVLPKWDLRAEFWVEGIGEDINDAGAFLYLTTDQVRFYPINARENSAHAGGGGYYTTVYGQGIQAEPLEVEQIPPIVFSEIMRDVDLFVGVASVGNDPNWLDTGTDGDRRDYWYDYSFGELSVSARTRKEILEKVIPRLKIAPRCSFDDKFLIVDGDIRSYKIHLGSGNILMKPNDEYLCIVQGRSGVASSNKVFLPFEGDQRIAVILSKAFVLAEDKKIDDPTITRQINRR